MSDMWVSGNRAAEIISKNSGHTVLPAYIRWLARNNKIRFRPINRRENEYCLEDIEKYKVEGRGNNRPPGKPTIRQVRAQKKFGALV